MRMLEIREAPVPVRIGWRWHYETERDVICNLRWGKYYDKVFETKGGISNLLGRDVMHVLLDNGQTIIVRAKP